MKIFVVGNGAFGTAVAEMLARAGREVVLWCSTHDYPHLKLFLTLQRAPEKENYLYLSGTKLNPKIMFTDKLDFAETADVILLAQPSKHIFETFLPICEILKKNRKAVVALLSKGFSATYQTLGERMLESLKSMDFHRFAVISGPTFASEILKPYQLHFASCASKNLSAIKQLKKMTKGTSLALVGTTDIVGVSLGGCLKNAYAAGYGLILKQKGKSAAFDYIWLALREMKLFLDYVGASPRTLWSPAAQGDFYVTCRGNSRNRAFGEFLAEYHSKDEINEYLTRNTIEGYESMKKLWGLVHYNVSQKMSFDAPLLYGIHSICEFGASPDTFVDCFLRAKNQRVMI